MKLSFELTNELVALPAAPLLSALPNSAAAFNTDHQLRPPLGIYNTSINLCLERLETAVTLITAPELRDTFFSQTTPFERRIIEAYDAFLDAMMEHMEDCLSVMLTFFATTKERERHPAVKQYRKSVADYREHIGCVVNHIKHSQGRLRLCGIRSTRHFVLGYFVEGVDEKGTLGPAPQIHRNGNNAFSFHRDLRLHIGNLFLVSNALMVAVEEIAGASTVLPMTATGNEGLTTILRTVSSLPKTVFRHELALDWPKITMVPSNGKQGPILKVEFPCPYERPVTPTGRLDVVNKFTGDGVSKSFRFPL